MKKEIILNFSGGRDYTSDWMPMNIDGWKENTYRAKSLQINWKDAVSLGGNILIRVSNDEVNFANIASFQIDSADNSSDVLIYELNTSAEFISIQFNNLLTMSGKISAIITYRKEL